VEALIVTAGIVAYRSWENPPRAIAWPNVALPVFLGGEGRRCSLPALPLPPLLAPAMRPPGWVSPLDDEPRIAVDFGEYSHFSISCTKLRDPDCRENMRRLTGHDRGETNSTLIRVDGQEYEFGRQMENVRFLRDKANRLWKERHVTNATTGGRCCLTIMDWKKERIRVTQSVEIVLGATSRLYDTVLVKYTVENADPENEHTVGLRFLLDTQMGATESADFDIGPSEQVKVHPPVSTMATFTKTGVPAFIHGNSDETDIGGPNSVVTEMRLQIPGFEPVEKLVIGRWPGENAAWEWRPFEMNPVCEPPHSSVALYWNLIKMPPADRRICGFRFGLGRLIGNDAFE
jgi:hypothetical protein